MKKEKLIAFTAILLFILVINISAEKIIQILLNFVLAIGYRPMALISTEHLPGEVLKKRWKNILM